MFELVRAARDGKSRKKFVHFTFVNGIYASDVLGTIAASDGSVHPPSARPAFNFHGGS